MNGNPYGGNAYGKELQKYREQAIFGMTKGEMLTLLYDEALKSMTKLRLLEEEKQYEQFNYEAERILKIFKYLISCLDNKYPVSLNLYKLYEFFNYQISRAKASRKLEAIDEIIPLIVELRDAFKEADRMTRTEKQLNPQMSVADRVRG